MRGFLPERASVRLARAVAALLDVLAAADMGAVDVAAARRGIEQVAPRDRVSEAALILPTPERTVMPLSVR